MAARMKRSKWKEIKTLKYQTRHIPAKTLGRLGLVSAGLGRHVSKEMVLALALEYGLDVIQRNYVDGALDWEATEKLFRQDFADLFDAPGFVIPEPELEGEEEGEEAEEENGND